LRLNRFIWPAAEGLDGRASLIVDCVHLSQTDIFVFAAVDRAPQHFGSSREDLIDDTKLTHIIETHIIEKNESSTGVATRK
jgi:hypothetical protein